MTGATYSVVGGAISSQPEISRDAIKQGTRNPYVPHSYQNLTECPCAYLDRFTSHGRRIREAYENAIVAVVRTVTSFQPRGGPVISPEYKIVVIGSGGLLQEACWLTKLFYQIRQKKEIVNLSLHLIDTAYKQDNNPIPSLVNYAKQIVSEGSKLNIDAWSSCKAAKEANLSPHLVIGMDTEHATESAEQYQWELLAGDVEKTLLVRWKLEHEEEYIHVYSRKGSTDLECKRMPLSDPDAISSYIRNAAVVG